MQITVGSIIRYADFTGAVRTVKVTAIDADIKNGRPGFDGTVISSTSTDDKPGMAVWGYADQILPGS
jgi:hypothetical protein